MRVNVVVEPGWILERLAQELAARLPDVRVNAGGDARQVDPGADLNYYLPAKSIDHHPPEGRAAGFFTHGEKDLRWLSRQFAVRIAMNQHMAARLTAVGARSVVVIRPGTEVPERPVVFGVIGRLYKDGRKGEQLVAQAVAARYRFIGCRCCESWPCPEPYTFEERDQFYAAIDYLVVTATEEGGPMPVLEAIARGVPVIAPDVGWCFEFPVIRYRRGSWASLSTVLSALTQPPTWEAWAEGHRRVFDRLARKAA
jgi:hypothetical protein